MYSINDSFLLFSPFSSWPPPSSGTSCQNRERLVQKRPDDTMFCSFLASDSESGSKEARSDREEWKERCGRWGEGCHGCQIWDKAPFTSYPTQTEGRLHESRDSLTPHIFETLLEKNRVLTKSYSKKKNPHLHKYAGSTEDDVVPLPGLMWRPC